MAESIDPEVVEQLRCPVSKSRVRVDGDWVVAEVGGLAYPVRDGIAVMLPEEARFPAGVQSLADLRAALNAQQAAD